MILGNPLTLCRILTGSVFGARNAASPRPAPAGQTVIVQAAEARRVAGLPSLAADTSGNISAFFAGAGSLAGPFIMFRLKRCGYSAARVKATPKGLLVTARR
ncbi:MAG TPA: hypothetical protein VNX25_02585 [Verrucomicrobiae bacterium]|nr:hypothetical protein [Verrucomicrobiae bacterium]